MQTAPSLDDRPLPQDISNLLHAAAGALPPELLRALGTVAGLGGEALPPMLFLEAVEQAPLAISITDTKANILYANPAFERITGYSREELLGKNESILSNRATPGEVYRRMWENLSQGRRWGGLLVNRHRDGKPYLAELEIAPVADATGAITHYLGLHRDVSEVHRLSQSIQNQNTLLETVMDAAPFALVLLDLEGRPVLSNRGFRELEQRLGKGRLASAALRAISGYGGGDLRQTPALREGFRDREISLDSSAAGEVCWFSCSGVWIEQADSRADAYFQTHSEQRLLLTLNEITALKREQEQARRNAMRALMAEHEMSEKIREAFAGAIFQLEANLHLARAASGMLERRGDQDPLRSVFAQVVDAGERALDVLRAGAPGESPESRGTLSLNQAVRDVLGLMTERMLAEGVEIDWTPARENPSLQGYATGLNCAIKQLVANAIDAMGEPAARGKLLRIFTQVQGGLARLVVQDQGPGIPEGMRFRIFEPFFTGWSDSRQHTGVGLSAAREMFSRHGGEIAIDPACREGCRVVVTLPLTDGASNAILTPDGQTRV